MRKHWNALAKETRWVILLAVGFVLFRVGIASLSGFGFHQGWNEGHYALIASGFLDHPLVPRYGDNFVYNVPPLFPYAVSASFLLFGESVLAARLPSILATGGLIIATYELGREVFGDRSTALVGALIFATLPYVQLFGGRAQTDMLMVFFVTTSVTAIVKGYRRQIYYRRWIVVGAASFAAAVATKQPALAVSGIVFFWLLGNRRFDRDAIRRTALLIATSAICLLPVAGWFYLNYVTAPAAFVADWEHELLSRTPPFANVRLLVAIAFGLGVTPPVIFASTVGFFTDIRDAFEGSRINLTGDKGPSILLWWLLFYGIFVLVRTPHGHQYYAVILTPPIALISAQGIQAIATRFDGLKGYGRKSVRVVLIVFVLSSTVAGTVVLFELSGEFSAANGGGTTIASEAGDFVIEETASDATILVSNGYAPPLKWYVKDDRSVEQVEAYHVSSLTKQRIQSTISESEGAVYVVLPSPSWGKLPAENSEEIYHTAPYRFTLASYVGDYVATDSKFTFYLNDRRLVIYRVE
ncbi:ArnT family glycosyltransferase [Halobellus salinisoli]|uniref:ArnT family glycosyltransferase n=1 Tax=Halobellus salinisoli TaxID=3108500 RepID=UPI00300B699C